MWRLYTKDAKHCVQATRGNVFMLPFWEAQTQFWAHVRYGI